MTTWLVITFPFLATGCDHVTKSWMMGSKQEYYVPFLDQFFRKKVLAFSSYLASPLLRKW